MDILSDSDVASTDLDCALSKKAGKWELSLLKRILDKICRSKTAIVHKAHFPKLHSSRK